MIEKTKSVGPILLSVLIISSVLLAGCGAGQKETVKIAFLGPISGGLANMGLGGRNSVDLAIREANADPNTKYQYELMALDDECKPDVGVQAALRAASDDKVIGAVAHFCSAVALGTVDIYHQHKLPIIVWGAIHPDITYGNDYPEVMRVCVTLRQQNEVIAQFAWDHGYREISVLHDTTDYGRGHAEWFTHYFEELGGKILSKQGLNADQTDVTAELTSIKSENPDAIYFGGLAPLGVSIRLGMEKLGMLDTQLIGTSGITNTSFIEGVGEELCEGIPGFTEGAPIEDMPGGPEFLANYEEAGFEEPPEAYGPFAYSAAKLFIEAIEAVGPDRVAVAEYLNENVKNKETVIGPVTFDEHGQNIEPLITTYICQNGEYVPWEYSMYSTGERELLPPNK